MAGIKNIKDHIIHFLGAYYRNIIVVMACVLGLGVSLWFFWRDLKVNEQNPDKKPVGTVYWVNNDVKRLSTHHLQWDRLDRYSVVFNGDIISSGISSEARISFTGGELLELSPNTSVRIVYQDSKRYRFILREGEIQVQSSRNETIVSLAESAAVEVANSELRMSLNPGTNAGIKATGGEPRPFRASAEGTGINALDGYTIKIYQGSGTFSSRGVSRTIEAGEALNLGMDGSARADPPVIMLAPQNGTRLLWTSGEKVPVEFRWKQLNPSAGSIALEIAQTSNFSRLEGSWYPENTDSAEIELSAGTYHWRIYTLSSPEEADSGRLDIIYTQGPLALSPADGAVVETFLPKQEIRFSWIVPEEAEAVMLEVADNSDIRNPKIRQLINRTTRGRGSYYISELEKGQWYWRIHPVYPGWKTAEQDQPSLSTGSGQNYWRALLVDHPSPVNSFILSESMKPPIQRLNSDIPSVKPGSLPELIFPPDNYELEANRTPDLLFTWKNTFSNNARFQMSEHSDFFGSMIKDEEVYGSSIQGPFYKPGIYYWRLIGADPENVSHPHRLVVIPALPSPRLDSPQEDNERLIIQEGVAVKFSWNPVNYANYYRFKLFLEGRELPLREVSSLQNNSINVYFDPNTQGRFTWTVQGFTSPTENSTGRSGLIARGRFYVVPETSSAEMDQISWSIPRIANMQAYAGEVDSPITLVSPVQGFNIPGIQALRSPPEARWVSDVPLTNIQLIVSRTTDPSSDPRSIVRNVSGTSVTFPSLSEGIWYWIIRGDTSELRGATPGDPFWFNVLPIPLFPAPRPIEPENRAVIGLEQLTRDRNIRFRWNSVEGANAYIFSLYQNDTTPKLLFTSFPQTALFYVFDNLSLLNNGNYFWQTEAIFLDNTGNIEQRGGTVQFPFSIEIQRSNDIRITGQGTLYGQ